MQSPVEADLQVRLTTDFAPLDDRSPRRRPVAAAIADATHEAAAVETGHESERLLGSLVHRLLQQQGLADVSDERIFERVASLLRLEESTSVVDRDLLFHRAVGAYRAFSSHPDLHALYHSGTAFHEVPFSLAVDGQIVRGAIDCLVEGRDGVVTVLEFKTGRRRLEHAAQADLYRSAAQSLFPGRRVVTQLLYAGDVANP